MMKINNYIDYDNLTLYVKKNKAKEIIEHYAIFGWKLVCEKQNKTYEDIIDISFTRPHKISNKDELQLQQVYMEERLNALGKLERHKHARSTSIGLCIGVMALVMIILGVLIALKVNSVQGLVVAIVIVVVGVILTIIDFVNIPQIRKNENLIYEQKHDELEVQLFAIFTKVKELMGGGYGQN